MKQVLLLLFTILCTQILWAQTRTVTGTVTDDKGAQLARVSVQVKGANTGTTTADDGSFSLAVPANARTLVFSTVGMETKEASIGSDNTVSISLQSQDRNLQEVVVAGYGT